MNKFGGYKEFKLTEAGFADPGTLFRRVSARRLLSCLADFAADVMTTWNRNFRTAAGIGPCSTIAEMKQAYGEAVQPPWSRDLPRRKGGVGVGGRSKPAVLHVEGPEDDQRGRALPGIGDGHAA